MTKLMNINELSQRAGIRPRTIRSYIQQGIIPAPTELGRYAKYSKNEHLLPLLIASDLRNNQKWSLEEIRSFLMLCSKKEMENLAQNVSRNLTKSINTGKSPKTESAVQYLQNLNRSHTNLDSPQTLRKIDHRYLGASRSQSEYMSSKLSQPTEKQSQTSHYPPTFDRTPIEQLSHKLSSLLEDKKYVTRKASLQNWKKVEVTPEIEINIRMERDLSDREKNAIEQIADYLREIITRR